MATVKSILVTGGCGFIGSNFVQMMLVEHPQVTIVNFDALTYAGNLNNLRDVADAPGYHFIRSDICDEAAVEQAIKEHKIEGIINFAAESHVDRSITGPGVFVDTNVAGTVVLLQQAQKNEIKRYLQVSTDEVYGALGNEGKFSESSPLSPSSPYAASKAAADLLVQSFHHTYGLNTVITRCSNNYGPYQFPEKLIPLMFNNARKNKSLPVYGKGQNVRDWIHVYDHCTAVWAAFTRGAAGEVYNIGANCEKMNIDIVRAILAYLSKPESLIQYVTDRLGHDYRYAIDATKARNELHWAPKIPFDDGLIRTLGWYYNNQDWISGITSGKYQQYYEEMYGNR